MSLAQEDNKRVKELHLSSLLFLLLFFYLSVLILYPQYPPDDFWRHLRVGELGYDYRELFLDPLVPKKDYYLAFDFLLSLLSKVFGIYAFIPLQMLCLLLYSLGLYFALREHRNRELVMVVFLCVMAVVFGRVVLARPTVLASALFVFLWFSPIKNPLKPLLMSLFTPFYYLTPLYTFAFTFRTPLFGGLAFSLSLLILLLMYGTDLFGDVLRLLFHHRIEGLEIKENKHPLLLIASPAVFALAGIRHYRRDLPTFLASLFFLMSLQVRYAVEVFVPLIASLSRFEPFVRIPQVSVLPFLSLVLMGVGGGVLYDYGEVRHILKDKRVLFGVYGGRFFQGTYFIKGKFSPSMEVGYSTPQVQRLLKKEFSCDYVKGYDYFVEDWLTYKPECLELKTIYKELRIWRIKN